MKEKARSTQAKLELSEADGKSLQFQLTQGRTALQETEPNIVKRYKDIASRQNIVVPPMVKLPEIAEKLRPISEEIIKKQQSMQKELFDLTQEFDDYRKHYQTAN